jgi:ADP-heptose:LPS heptosyltransferase
MGALVPGAERIAVLRAGGLGDFVFTLPALDALRAAYPQAEIVLVGAPWHREFLRGRPGPVDRVEIAPPSRGIREPARNEAEDHGALATFFGRMRDQRFDLALQLHGGGRFSNPFVWRIGARVTAGLRAADAPPLDRCVPYVYYQPEVVRYLEVVALVGAAPRSLEPAVAVTAADRAAAEAALAGLPDPVVALHPGAGDPRRRWPAAAFAEVGDGLADAGASVVVVGAPEEAALVDEVVAGMRAPARGLGGGVDLGGLAGVLARARVLVANDSGPRHLAAALGTATVGVFWGPNIVNAAPWTRARHRPHAAWPTTCPVCGAARTESRFPAPDRRCAHPGSWVEAVPVADVLADALDLLACAAETARSG